LFFCVSLVFLVSLRVVFFSFQLFFVSEQGRCPCTLQALKSLTKLLPILPDSYVSAYGLMPREWASFARRPAPFRGLPGGVGVRPRPPRGRSRQSVPSSKTVQRTVLEFTPCRSHCALGVFRRLRPPTKVWNPQAFEKA